MNALSHPLIRRSALLAALAFLSAQLKCPADPLPTKEAASHVGETLTVTGVVAQVSSMNGGVTFINFGQRHPNSEFTVVVRPGEKDFGDLKRFEGKQVEAEGKIELYKEKPQMVVRDPGMLRESGGAAPAPSPSPTPPQEHREGKPMSERPGAPVEFAIPLTPEEKKLAGRSPSGVVPEEATVAVALPKGFDPSLPNKALIAFASDKPGSNNQNLHRFSFPANKAGWVALAVNGPALEDGLSDDWHAAMTLAAFRFLQEKYPDAKNWKIILAGSGLGGARASMVSCALIQRQLPLSGILMTSFGGQRFDDGQNHFRTKKSALRDLAVFATRGANDHTPPEKFEAAEKELRSLGFKKLIIDKHAGGPDNEQQSLTRAFEWLSENGAPPAKAPSKD